MGVSVSQKIVFFWIHAFLFKGLPPLVAQKKAFFMNFFKENYKTFLIDHYIILKNTS